MVPVQRRASSSRAVSGLIALRFACLILMSWVTVSACRAQVGHEFRLAWPETGDARGNDPDYDLDAQLVVLAVREQVRVRVQGPGLDRTLTARPGSPGLLRLDRDAHQVTALDTPVAQGLHVMGLDCEPFAVLLRVPGSGASVADDVARVLPVPLLGRRYFPVAALGLAEFVVVASEDGTLVEIEDPLCPSPAPVVLDAGEVLQHRCEGGPDGGDVTGTVVRASAPVAVLTGSASSKVLAVREGGDELFFWDFSDVLLEGLWPAELFGRRFVHAPFPKASPLASGDALRVVSACPSNRLWLEAEGSGSVLVSLADEGAHAWLGPTGSDERAAVLPGAARLDASQPMQVAALTVGHANAGHGDPSLTLLDPEERWEHEALAWLPEGYVHSLGLTVRSEHAASVRVDGSTPFGSWRAIGRDHVWMQLRGVSAGEHRVSADGPVFVQVSGVTGGGLPGAYSYPAVAVPPGGVPRLRVESDAPTCSRACAGTCFELALPAGFGEAAWSNGSTDASTSVCLSEPTPMTVTARGPLGCLHATDIDLPINPPGPAGPIEGPDALCAGECVTLGAPPGHLAWHWSTGGTAAEETICPEEEQLVGLEILDEQGCLRTTEHLLRVEHGPVPGAVRVAPRDPCAAEARLSWLDAEWPEGSEPGVYHVYRRAGGCAPLDDPSWQLLEAGLETTSFRDRNVPPGREWTWLIVAETEGEDSACPGPMFGGPVGAVCSSPERFRAPLPPPAPGPVSPWLRVHDVERDRPGGACLAVTLSWDGAEAAPPGTESIVRRSDRPEALLAWRSAAEPALWRDADAGDAELLFYRIRRVDPCGRSGD